ncbi:tigger transposable element-derived protein 1-like [Tachyglossus aculeatus]|uniref:tigger transposable element-derived protein 1-like n=1 Tax=Tachyglossus aculeatus TaxID=9261 RepID=UPI0018F37CEA|nr:tigger transposable element-derived protein 1-like [Tachyglossus aculeatus]
MSEDQGPTFKEEMMDEGSVTMEDVAGSFAHKEWEGLNPAQRNLYWDAMLENYGKLASLGFPVPKAETGSQPEERKDPWGRDAQEPEEKEAPKDPARDAARKPGSGGAKRAHKTVTFETKMEILRRLDGGERQGQVARSLGLPHSTVSTIVKNRARIVRYVQSAGSLQAVMVNPKRGALLEETERLLTLWLDHQARRRVPVNQAVISAKARSLHEALRERLGDGAKEEPPFCASHGWFARFKRRAGRPAGPAAAAASAYRAELAGLIAGGGYGARQVFNVDETGLFWKKLPDSTSLAREEKRAPGRKPAKDRLTLLLGGNAAGDFKVKPLLVYHAENPRAFRGKVKASLPVLWRSGPKGRVTPALFQDWFAGEFVPAVRAYLRRHGLAFKALLLLDRAPGHPPALGGLVPGVSVAFLPPAAASLLQPMEQAVSAVFKRYYARRTLSQALAATEGGGGAAGPALRDFWRGYDIWTAARNLGDAWAEVGAPTLNGSWAALCPQFLAADPRPAPETPEGLTREIVALGRRLRLEMDAADVDGWMDAHPEESLSDDDLLECRRRRRGAPGAEAGGPAPPPARPGLGPGRLAAILRKADELLEAILEEDPDRERSARVRRGVRRELACYRSLEQKQKKEKKKAAPGQSDGTSAADSRSPFPPTALEGRHSFLPARGPPSPRPHLTDEGPEARRSAVVIQGSVERSDG